MASSTQKSRNRISRLFFSDPVAEPSPDPVLRKPAPQYVAPSPTKSVNNTIDRPLPPLPPMASPGRLQKVDSSKRTHERNTSNLNLPQPFEDLQVRPPADPAQTTIASSASAISSRPSSTGSGSDSEGINTSKTKKRSSWLPGSRSRSRQTSQDTGNMQSAAWIKQDGMAMDYSLRPLLEGHKVGFLTYLTQSCADEV